MIRSGRAFIHHLMVQHPGESWTRSGHKLQSGCDRWPYAPRRPDRESRLRGGKGLSDILSLVKYERGRLKGL
jgi:hypothetical protein